MTIKKQLLLLRHARAEWPPGQKTDDLKKPLNPLGEKQVPAMGLILRDRDIQPDAIISSPANRAITTARIIAEYLGFPKSQIKEDQRIYENTLNDLLSVIEEIDDEKKCVMIVGHNPALSLLAGTLCLNNPSELSTCSVCHVEIETDAWKNIAALQGSCSIYQVPEA